MAATVDYQSQATEVSSKKHAACDECRGRKLKCSGDFPQCVRCGTHDLVCHYSDQKPMGRPRKRRRSNPSQEQDGLDMSQLDFMDGISDPWPTSEDTMQMNEVYPLTTPWPTLDENALAKFAEPGLQPISILTPKPMPEIDFSDWQPPDFSIPSPFTTTPSLNYTTPEHTQSPNTTTTSPATTPHTATCACLSTLYATLISFQTLLPPTFPPSLAPLRTAMSTARTAIHCPHCPTNFPTALQNMMLLGTLFPLILDHYRRLLLAIEADAADGRPKMYRIGDASPATAHLHTNAPDCPMGVDIELGADDWRRMARKVVRRDVLGKEDGSAEVGGMVGLVRDIERRQRSWHAKNLCDKSLYEDGRGSGSPGSEGDGHRHGEGDHLCLKIVGLAKAGLAGLDLDTGGRAGGVKAVDASADADVVVEEVVVAAPSKQTVKFSDNINRWPFTSINF